MANTGDQNFSNIYTYLNNLQMCVSNLTTRVVELERRASQQRNQEHARQTLREISELAAYLQNASPTRRRTPSTPTQPSSTYSSRPYRSSLANTNYARMQNEIPVPQPESSPIPTPSPIRNNSTSLNYNPPPFRSRLENSNYARMQRSIPTNSLLSHSTPETTPAPVHNIDLSPNNPSLSTTNLLGNTTLPDLNTTNTTRTFQNTNNGTVETIELTFSNPTQNGLQNASLENLFSTIFNGSSSSMNHGLTINQLRQNTALFTYNEEFRNSLETEEEGEESEEGEQEHTCTICRDTFVEGDSIRQLNQCKHYYHTNCIDTWFEEHHTCPHCRQDISI